jgi:hypothetical protein
MAICQPLGAAGSPAALNHRPAFVYSVSSETLPRQDEPVAFGPASAIGSLGRPRRQDWSQPMKTNPWRIVAALGLAAAGVGILVLIVNNNNAG